MFNEVELHEVTMSWLWLDSTFYILNKLQSQQYESALCLYILCYSYSMDESKNCIWVF